MRPVDGISRAEIRLELANAAKALQKAAKALNAILSVEFPYPRQVLQSRNRSRLLLGNEIEGIQNGFRLPLPQEAAEHLRLLQGVAAGFSGDEWETMSPEIAEAWKRVSAMDDAEYYAHFAHERAQADHGVWLMPFHVSENVFAVLRGKRIGSEAVIRMFSAELLGLAKQARLARRLVTILGSPSGRGRKRELAEQSFRVIFADYAERTTGQRHDQIGARLFRLLFGTAMEVEDYARQRRAGKAAGRRRKCN
jgi:hypothetical protein